MEQRDESVPIEGRRGFLASGPFWLMTGGLISGYGAFTAMGVRYLFPQGRTTSAWLLLGVVRDFVPGSSLDYRAPDGQAIAVARQGDTGTVEDFVALSSTCPHLGCQVHWEAANERFFCPCHNGVFDAQGTGISGPPGEAGQVLPRFPLRIRDGLLFIEVPIGGLTASAEPASPAMQRVRRLPAPGPGHDPCLGSELA